MPGEEDKPLLPKTGFLPVKTKVLAWIIFLIFFIEAGTLGLVPKSYYFVYRNVRVSDLLMYYVIIYSLFNLREFSDLYRSKSFIIVKCLIVYIFFQFIVSAILYKVDILEYFFRLKSLWMSLLVFPFLLLLRRGGFEYLIKLFIPVALVSNVFYIIASLTGVSLYPEISMVLQDLPGGLKVYRVFGGTFFGEFFFLGIIFYWNEIKFKFVQIPLVILFALPHVLAFGRNAWLFFVFAIIFIIIWASYRKRNFSALLRQSAIIAILVISFTYFFNQFIPQADEISEAIEARVQQGRDDIAFGEGTFGTRVANIEALVRLWQRYPIIGIGMHPMWVIKAETTEEHFYAWGFADVRWAGVLAAYGIIGFTLAMLFQVYYMVVSFKLLRKIKEIDVSYYMLLLFLIYMSRDLFINYVYYLTTITLSLLGSVTAFFVANLVYLYEKHSKEKTEENTNGELVKQKLP